MNGYSELVAKRLPTAKGRSPSARVCASVVGSGEKQAVVFSIPADVLATLKWARGAGVGLRVSNDQRRIALCPVELDSRAGWILTQYGNVCQLRLSYKIMEELGFFVLSSAKTKIQHTTVGRCLVINVSTFPGLKAACV